jgi:hypothetical protein
MDVGRVGVARLEYISDIRSNNGPESWDRARPSRSKPRAQNSALPGVRGNGITSRILAIPVA